MAIKKTELYSSLWASCDELRGGMDASQYKDYVLTFLFLKYVSDKYQTDPKAMIVVPAGCAFADLVSLKGDKEIGEKLNIALDGIAKENDLPWLANKDNDFNDEERLGKGKEMVDRLSKLIGIFEGLDFGGNSAQGDDLLGDAYEYLMRNFATESGKSKGQFYTPAEVSRILAKVVGITKETAQDQTVYDPTCGSGSLLLKAADEASNGLTIYGQEKDVATTALCRMNMILHNNADAEIAPGGHSTLAEPEYKQDNASLKTFDFAVANPPFSFKAWNTGFLPQEDQFSRFEYGIPPEKNGDYAFLLHILKSLKSTGKGAVILPHGVLFRGNAEADIRRNLIKQGYIKGIIGLPANLFYGTGIPACILVIDKAGARERLTNTDSGIFMVDAGKGFMKDGPKNRLRDQDIHKIVDVFNHQLEQIGYSRMVGFDEIAGNDYNLNIPRYIDSSAAEDLHDLSAHLSGGIPNRDIDALAPYWQVFPTLRNSLFEAERDGYSRALVKATEVKNTILAHPEFKQFAQSSVSLFEQWTIDAKLSDIDGSELPKAIIHRISESLLQAYTAAPLLDRYDMYQIIMNYWVEVMQDDVYVITQDGWNTANDIRQLVVKKGEKLKETPDLIVNKAKYKAAVIPPALIIQRFFSEQQSAIDALKASLDAATQELETYVEEHGVEGGLLEEAINDSGKVNKASVTARLKHAIETDEVTALKRVKTLLETEAEYKRAVKTAQEALDKITLEKYPQLTEAEIKTLIVEDKWLATLRATVIAEIERVTQQLANRVKTLEERYAEPLSALSQDVEVLSGKVDEHLKMMGLQW
ncbi:type I restriction-modification system subunit M [Amphritea japonica]|uniref:site-specific DNA-methyltransferase (adenine-specific) n=1 Tax=Amphritea japonica ATCC BAA-1530 TaxID=1278309 RepID=A0A7R6PNX7_9GAMM|nr:type I restriction-modification system subunit M [Amphritea japonica]BBB26818.1 type I restriction enzyme M protein [Amphritea japonica ATCC BAA-1530]